MDGCIAAAEAGWVMSLPKAHQGFLPAQSETGMSI